MKPNLILASLLFLSCATNDRNGDSEFNQYLNSLENISTPLTLSCHSDVLSSITYDTMLWHKFRDPRSTRPCGKIILNDSTTLLVEVNVGEFTSLLLTTYDKHGNKRDSLAPFIKSGLDLGYISCEYMTINSSQEVIVIDSTSTWKIDATKQDVISGTQKLTIDTVIYKIDSQGKFKTANN